MKSTRALALSLSLVVTALTFTANATPVSCEITTPGKLTKSEIAQLEAKGYRISKDRSKFHHERFLGVYEYYELKNPAKQTGGLYLNAILSPHPKQANSFGPIVSMVSRREFRLMLGNGKYESTLHIATSQAARFAENEAELMNADFSSLPACRD